MSGFYQRFGLRLRVHRKEAGLTQDQVASRLGVNRTTIVNIEKGRQRVALHQLVELADILGCAPGDLLPSGDDQSSPIVGVIPEGAAFVSRIQSKRARS